MKFHILMPHPMTYEGPPLPLLLFEVLRIISVLLGMGLSFVINSLKALLHDHLPLPIYDRFLESFGTASSTM